MARNDMHIGKYRVLICIAAMFGAETMLAAAQTKAATPYPTHLPYRFSNFVWWTDDELRAELKKRIPGLGDEVGTNTAAEGRIRNSLTALLKQKGIEAEIQSEEPSLSALQPIPSDLLNGVPEEDIPPTPKPAVIFMIVRPQVRIGKIDVECDAVDARQAVAVALEAKEGREFTETNEAFIRFDVERAVKRLGYFNEQVSWKRGAPVRHEDTYTVDFQVDVNAGAKYRVASISADGGPLFAAKDLSQFFSVRPGETAVQYPFGRLGPGLKAFYEQQGYADVQLKVDTSLDREHASVSYALHVIPGPVYHLRNLSIEKLSPEQEKRVREIFGMRPNELYRDQAITDLYHRIPNEALLKGYSFAFSPKRDKAAAQVDLKLSFFKEGGDATVTVK